LAGPDPKYIGRYRADRVVGSGAFATVWLAVDETLNAPVAIKVLAENWAHDEEVRQRFLEEARILWRADSDHIVRIHNVDELPDGRPYFVMDFADRGTLLQRMRGRLDSGGRYSIDEAIAISLEIGDGLKVAHGLGVVHRDLKPANIMYQSIGEHHGGTADEKLILTDFGMAKSVARGRGTTIATGTPYYMAPEQTEGRADERSDIYSAGVVLYELLAGRVPYPYDSPGRLFAAQVAAPPAPITTLRDDVPKPLEETLNRALATDPDQRWPNAEAWTNALGAAAKGESPPAAAPLPGVDPDMARTMAPAEIAAARAEAEAATPPPPAQPVTPGPIPAAVPAAAATPPATPPPAAPPRAAAGDAERRRRRKRTAAIGLPVVGVIAAVVAIVFALVLTGTSQADARRLTLQPVSGLGLNPFSGSLVPTVNTPISRLQIPKSFKGKLPQQLIGSGSISKQDLLAKLTRINNTLLQNLNPAIGALSKLKLPLGGFQPSSNGRPQVFAGSAPGLYGGTQLLTVCDKRAMIEFLERNEDKLKAWAGVQGISPSDVPGYISHLTDVILRFDTRVTNHGYLNGKATTIDEVLQKGMAVLIDEYGIPRARCYCGNPLTPPRTLVSNPKILGKRWPGFSLGKTVDPKKTKKAPEVGLVDVVTGTTAVYKIPGAPPEDTTLTPQQIDPIPGTVTPPVVSISVTPPPPTNPPPSTVPPPPVTPPPPTSPPPPPPPIQVSNVTSQGSVSASSTYSGFSTSEAIDNNLSTSWFSIGSREGDTSTFTWTSTQGAILVDHVTIYSNAHNSDSNIANGNFTFSSIQVSVLHNGVVTATSTVAYPSDHVDVQLGHVGDTVKMLLIHHTNPACGGFGELYVFGGAVASSPPPPSSGGGARSASDAQAVVKALLDKNASACHMTYSTFATQNASATSGWLVAVNVTTSGNPGVPVFLVKTGGTEAVPEDQLSSEIQAGCP
jgi:Protein kinase domain